MVYFAVPREMAGVQGGSALRAFFKAGRRLFGAALPVACRPQSAAPLPLRPLRKARGPFQYLSEGAGAFQYLSEGAGAFQYLSEGAGAFQYLSEGALAAQAPKNVMVMSPISVAATRVRVPPKRSAMLLEPMFAVTPMV